MRRFIPARMKFLVNKREIYCSVDYPFCSVSRLLSELFQSTANLELWSEESLQKYAVGSLEFVKEYCVELKKEIGGHDHRPITALTTKINRYLRVMPKLNREQLLYTIYNLILSCEGLGTLPHFGMALIDADKKTVRLLLNPEKTAMRDFKDERK